MIPVDPEMEEAGPTREQRGSAAFRHIESKSPNPMLPVVDNECTDARLMSERWDR